MNNKDTVIQHIRFALDQLSARNAHHEFEHLCRHLARARICSNILPATGPVQAGGDQGRDFETFYSYLNSNSIDSSLFIGNAGDNLIAFACSLEKKPDRKNGKIVKDVDTILESGSNVDRIYFFSNQDIAVAKRNQVIKLS